MAISWVPASVALTIHSPISPLGARFGHGGGWSDSAISTRRLRLPSLRILSTRIAPISAMIADVRAAAGLQVDAGNAEQAHPSAAARRLHAHRLDQLGSGVELLVADPDGLRFDAARDERVRFALDACGIEQAHVDVEVEARLRRGDVASGNRRHHHAGHDVQRGMQPHQRIAPWPIDFERQRFPDCRSRGRGGCDVQNAVASRALAGVDDGNPLAARTHQHTGVALLTAARRVEDRAIEFDAVLVHGDDVCARSAQVRIGSEQQLGGHGTGPG